MCENLRVQPVSDLFASRTHHQLVNYLTVELDDEYAAGFNAFAYKWGPEQIPYANPPWSLFDRVVDKLFKDCSKIMLVTPY